LKLLSWRAARRQLPVCARRVQGSVPYEPAGAIQPLHEAGRGGARRDCLGVVFTARDAAALLLEAQARGVVGLGLSTSPSARPTARGQAGRAFKDAAAGRRACYRLADLQARRLATSFSKAVARRIA